MSGFSKVRQAFASMIKEQGVSAEFRLKDGAGTVIIDIAESWRSDESLTAGMSKENHRCRFMAHLWDQLASRPPEKGDQVTIGGQRRYSVLEAHVVIWENEPLAYVARLSG